MSSSRFIEHESLSEDDRQKLDVFILTVDRLMQAMDRAPALMAITPEGLLAAKGNPTISADYVFEHLRPEFEDVDRETLMFALTTVAAFVYPSIDAWMSDRIMGKKGEYTGVVDEEMTTQAFARASEAPDEPLDKIQDLLRIDTEALAHEIFQLCADFARVILDEIDEPDLNPHFVWECYDNVQADIAKNLRVRGLTQGKLDFVKPRAIRIGQATHQPVQEQPRQAKKKERTPPAGDQDHQIAKENRRLREELSSQESTIEDLQLQLDRVRDRLSAPQRMQERDVVAALKARVRMLELARKETPDEGEDEGTPIPGDLEALPTWAAEQLAGRVYLTKAAIKAAQSSNFAEPERIFRALLSLGTWVDMKRGTITREDLERALDAESLTIGPTGEATKNHRYRDSYQLQYRGRSLTMDFHLQGSASRDPRKCLRIYFTTVEEDGEVIAVVGHLPTHLRNYLSS